MSSNRPSIEAVENSRRRALLKLGLATTAIYSGLNVVRVQRASADDGSPSRCHHHHHHGGDEGGDDGCHED